MKYMIYVVMVFLSLNRNNDGARILVESENSRQIVYFRNFKVSCPNTIISLDTSMIYNELHIYCNNIEFSGNDTEEARRTPRVQPSPSNSLIVLHDFNDEIMQFYAVEGFGEYPKLLCLDCVDDTLKIKMHAGGNAKRISIPRVMIEDIDQQVEVFDTPNRMRYEHTVKLPGAGSKGAGSPKKRTNFSKQHVRQIKKMNKNHQRRSNSHKSHSKG